MFLRWEQLFQNEQLRFKTCLKLPPTTESCPRFRQQQHQALTNPQPCERRFPLTVVEPHANTQGKGQLHGKIEESTYRKIPPVGKHALVLGEGLRLFTTRELATRLQKEPCDHHNLCSELFMRLITREYRASSEKITAARGLQAPTCPPAPRLASKHPAVAQKRARLPSVGVSRGTLVAVYSRALCIHCTPG